MKTLGQINFETRVEHTPNTLQWADLCATTRQAWEDAARAVVAHYEKFGEDGHPTIRVMKVYQEYHNGVPQEFPRTEIEIDWNGF